MTPEQIDKMLEMHRYLIKCEIRQAFDKVSQDDRAVILQEEVNDRHWEDFGKWLKMIRDT
jgi:predicted oxidoreductase (fatty acid repression mutant protein)